MHISSFTTALHQGRGSAFLHLHDFPSDELFDILLDACLHNRAFDRQCEGPRAAWLHTLIAHDDRLCAAVLEAFENPVEEQDCFQVANLVGLFARNGNPEAAAALRHSWAENDLAGETAIIALDGVPAAIEVVRRLGLLLIADPDEYADSLEFLTDDAPLREQVLSELLKLAPGDAAISAYLKQHERRAAEQAENEQLTDEQRQQRWIEHTSKFISENPAARIIELARQPGKGQHFLFSRFGRQAPDSERQAILQALASEPDPKVQRWLLGVFRAEGLHEWDDAVWKLAHSEIEDVRFAAIRALVLLKDDRLGEFARRRIGDGHISAKSCDVIQLFTNHYHPGDELLILNALERANTDTEGMHRLGLSALRVCEANPDTRLAQLAIFIYRTNPCTLCRRDIVEWMKDMDCLPDWIANECRYDALDETRALV